jgi:formate--tetrahydrofolate ligase
MALGLADWVVTEAGFGFDLGAEKFFDIKCKSAGLDTAAVILVATCRALKTHGGVKLGDLTTPNLEALQNGLGNLDKHVENIMQFGEKPIVCLNRFAGDHDEEIDLVRKHCASKLQVPFALSNVFEEGGAGGIELAHTLIQQAEKVSNPYKSLYNWNEDVKSKIWKVANSMYGAQKIHYAKKAERDLASIKKLKYDKLPVCIAKTPASLTDDPKVVGRPENFSVTVREILIAAGAGFLIPITGDILRMPGLSKTPQAENIRVKDGRIEGIK